MGFTEIVDTALPATAATTTVTVQFLPLRPVSTLLAKSGKVLDKVLRQLRAVERAQKATIAARSN